VGLAPLLRGLKLHGNRISRILDIQVVGLAPLLRGLKPDSPYIAQGVSIRVVVGLAPLLRGLKLAVSDSQKRIVIDGSWDLPRY